MELSFRIKFSLSRKFIVYDFPTISKPHNVICHFRTTANRQTNRQETEIKNVTLRP